MNVDEAVTDFPHYNKLLPAEATVTIKITQGSTFPSVGIDTFTNNAVDQVRQFTLQVSNVSIVTQVAERLTSSHSRVSMLAIAPLAVMLSKLL